MRLNPLLLTAALACAPETVRHAHGRYLTDLSESPIASDVKTVMQKCSTQTQLTACVTGQMPQLGIQTCELTPSENHLYNLNDSWTTAATRGFSDAGEENWLSDIPQGQKGVRFHGKDPMRDVRCIVDEAKFDKATAKRPGVGN